MLLQRCCKSTYIGHFLDYPNLCYLNNGFTQLNVCYLNSAGAGCTLDTVGLPSSIYVTYKTQYQVNVGTLDTVGLPRSMCVTY